MTASQTAPETWDPALMAVADGLRDMGYDIEPSPVSGEPIRDIVARRDMGDRAVMLAIDASGRFRAALTWVVGEWPSRDEIGGVPVRVVDAVSRTVTITGHVETLDRMLPVVTALDRNAPSASIADTSASPVGES